MQKQHPVGVLSSPRPLLSHTLDAASDRPRITCQCVLVGFSKRPWLCFQRSGYTQADQTNETTSSTKFSFLRILYVLVRFGTLPLTLILIGAISGTKNAYKFPIAGVVYLLLVFLYHQQAINRIAHVMWVEDIGNGFYERRGVGEMSFRAFKRAGMEKMDIKLI